MRLHIEILGDKVVNRNLLRIQRSGSNLKPAYDAIHEDFFKIETQQFNAQGRFGGKWKPLAPATRAAKTDPRILHETLRLRRSLTSNNPDHTYYRRGDRVVMSTKVPYAKFHQRGTRHMPARPPVVITALHKRRWLKMIQSWVMRGRV